jgi:phosphoglycolate phosphatase
MLKLIVFDCDGVMFDSKMANIAYYNNLLNHFGLADMNEQEIAFVHMSSVMESVQYLFRDDHSISHDEVHSYRRQISYAPFLQYMTMEPDLIEFLELVKDSYHLAISTNRTDTMIPLLQSTGLEHYFTKVVTAATAKRPKPAPDGLLEILEHFNCAPRETIFIGDSIVDLEQAAACGVELIAFKNPELMGDYQVNSFMEILKLAPLQRSAC